MVYPNCFGGIVYSRTDQKDVQSIGFKTDMHIRRWLVTGACNRRTALANKQSSNSSDPTVHPALIRSNRMPVGCLLSRAALP